MTRERFAESLITELGKPGAIKSLREDIADLGKRGNKALKFFTETLEIVESK